MTYQVDGMEIEFDPERFRKYDLSVEELYNALESLRGSWKLQHPCLRANAFARVWLMEVDGEERPVVTLYAFDVSSGPVAQVTIGGAVTILDPIFDDHKLVYRLLHDTVRDCLQQKKWWIDQEANCKAPEGFVASKPLYPADAKSQDDLERFMTPEEIQRARREKLFSLFDGKEQPSSESSLTPPPYPDGDGGQAIDFKTPVIPFTPEDVRQLTTDTGREYSHLFGLDTQSPPPPIIHPSGVNQFAINRDWLEWRATKITWTAQMTHKEDYDPAQSFPRALQEAKEHVVRNNPGVFEGKEAEIVPYSSSHTAPYHVRVKKEQ